MEDSVRENILSSIKIMLYGITECMPMISEDTILYGIEDNKLDVCSLDLALWISEIELEYHVDLPIDIIKVADIIDLIIESRGN